MAIEPRIDAYGKDADGSLLADYVELLARAGDSLSQADLADLITDNEWKVRSRELITVPQDLVRDPDEEPSQDAVEGELIEDPGLEAAMWVFELLTERAETLGDRYPFEVEGVRLRALETEPRHGPYLVLLSITVAHAYALDTGHNPRTMFEETVARVLEGRVSRTVNMGAMGREGGNFPQALRDAGEALGLHVAPGAVPHRTHAQELGVDTISHLHWSDSRPGRWAFIGQATCAKTERWPQKMGEPTPGNWGPMLGTLVAPIPYLAVPHHAEEHHMAQITTDRRVLLLDRLRLCNHLEEPSDAERALVAAVLAEQVVRP
ncbi:MAG: hypothetical protein M3P34_02170 [Actinomycetota bacterium]|nr:hypothetical protein [Actinomycetota bacterium]